MTHSEPNAAQRLRNKVEQARLPVAQKEMKAIIERMESANSLVYECRGPFDSVLVELLQKEGFVVTTRMFKGTGDCDCDYAQACDNHDRIVVTVSVPN